MGKHKFTDFYKILFDTAKDNGNGCLTGNIDDIFIGFEKLGYKHYTFGGFEHVFTKKELSEIEYIEYEKEAQSIVDKHVKELTEHINKEIVNTILAK